MTRRRDHIGLVASLFLKGGDKVLGLRSVRIAVKRGCDDNALGRLAGDLDELLAVIAFLPDNRDIDAPGTQLANQRAGGKEVPGRIDRIRRVRLHLRDDGAELPVLHAVFVFVDDLDAEFARGFTETIGERLAEIVLQGDQDDPLLAHVPANQLRAGAALDLADEGSPENEIAGPGDVGMHGIGRDVGDASVLEDSGRGAGRSGIAAGYGDFYAVFFDQLDGDRHGLFRRRLVIIYDEFDLFPVDAALGVGLFDREFRAGQRGLAVGGGESRQGNVETDLDRVGQGRCCGKHRNSESHRGNPLKHYQPPVVPRSGISRITSCHDVP